MSVTIYTSKLEKWEQERKQNRQAPSRAWERESEKESEKNTNTFASPLWYQWPFWWICVVSGWLWFFLFCFHDMLKFCQTTGCFWHSLQRTPSSTLQKYLPFILLITFGPQALDIRNHNEAGLSVSCSGMPPFASDFDRVISTPKWVRIA